MLFTLLIATLIVLFVYKYLEDRLRFRKYKKLPPGPKGYPFIGYLPYLNIEEVHLSFTELTRKYGDIFCVQIGSRLAIVCNNYRTIKAAFMKNEISGRPTSFPFDHFPKGNYGIAAATGPLWVEQRRFVMRYMKELGMGKTRMEDLIMSDVNYVLNDLTKKANTNLPTDISSLLNLCILSATWNIMTCQRVGFTDEWFVDIANTIGYVLAEYLEKGASAVFFPTLFKLIPEKYILTDNYLRLETKIHKYIGEVIDEHKRTFKEDNLRDFIDIYIHEMNMRKEEGGHYFTDWQLQCIIADMFVGGVETTPNTLRWCVLLAATYPETQRKIQQQIDDNVGRDRPLTHQDRYLIPYCEAFISETQRFASISPLGIIHTVEADTTLDGYDIPEGSILAPNIYYCHRDGRVWEKPHDFYPEHFIDENGNHIQNREGYMPFSIGKRYCIGEGVARMELFLFFASFLQKFTFSLAPGDTVPLLPARDKLATRGCPDYKVIINARV